MKKKLSLLQIMISFIFNLFMEKKEEFTQLLNIFLKKVLRKVKRIVMKEEKSFVMGNLAIPYPKKCMTFYPFTKGKGHTVFASKATDRDGNPLVTFEEEVNCKVKKLKPLWHGSYLVSKEKFYNGKPMAMISVSKDKHFNIVLRIEVFEYSRDSTPVIKEYTLSGRYRDALIKEICNILRNFFICLKMENEELLWVVQKMADMNNSICLKMSSYDKLRYNLYEYFHKYQFLAKIKPSVYITLMVLYLIFAFCMDFVW